MAQTSDQPAIYLLNTQQHLPCRVHAMISLLADLGGEIEPALHMLKYYPIIRK